MWCYCLVCDSWICDMQNRDMHIENGRFLNIHKRFICQIIIQKIILQWKKMITDENIFADMENKLNSIL